MGKTIRILFLITMFALLAAPARADLIAGSSAAVSYREQNATSSLSIQQIALKRKVITEVLRRNNSPMVESVDSFLQTCTTQELDCYLLPSIAGVESTFGRFIMPGTNNAFGWGRGLIAFTTFGEGIETVGRGLRENYMNKGAESIDEIGSIYCEGNTWSTSVKHFMKLFAEEEKKQLFFVQDTVQL